MLSIHSGQEATLRVMDASKRSLPVQLLHVDGRLITASCDAVLPPATPVRLSWDKHVVMAEVISDAADAPPHQPMLLHIRHSLLKTDLEQIASLWKHLPDISMSLHEHKD